MAKDGMEPLALKAAQVLIGISQWWNCNFETEDPIKSSAIYIVLKQLKGVLLQFRILTLIQSVIWDNPVKMKLLQNPQFEIAPHP